MSDERQKKNRLSGIGNYMYTEQDLSLDRVAHLSVPCP